MKILIASDLHGCASSTEKLIECYREKQCERLVLLGDLLYHGPRNSIPNGYDCKRTAELLNSVSDEIIAVRGNCDSDVDQMLLDFPIISDYTIIFDGDTELFATHGHIYNRDNMIKKKRGFVLLNGHFHVNELSTEDEYHYVNPGSVSIPKGNMIKSYVVYENGCFTLYSLDDGSVMDKLKIK